MVIGQGPQFERVTTINQLGSLSFLSQQQETENHFRLIHLILFYVLTTKNCGEAVLNATGLLFDLVYNAPGLPVWDTRERKQMQLTKTRELNTVVTQLEAYEQACMRVCGV